MRERDVDLRKLPAALSPEFSNEMELALEFADGALSPEREAEVRQRSSTDARFREFLDAVVESWNVTDTRSAEQRARDAQEFLASAERRLARESAPRIRRVREESPAYVAIPTEPEWRRWARFALASILAMILFPSIEFLPWLDWRSGPLLSLKAPVPVRALYALQDSTMVQLEPGSSLRFSTRTAGELDGGALFVTRNIPLTIRTPAIELSSSRNARFMVQADSEFTDIAVERGEVRGNVLEADGSVGTEHPVIRAGYHVRVRTAHAFDAMGNRERDPVGTSRITVPRDVPRIPPLAPVDGRRP